MLTMRNRPSGFILDNLELAARLIWCWPLCLVCGGVGTNPVEQRGCLAGYRHHLKDSNLIMSMIRRHGPWLRAPALRVDVLEAEDISITADLPARDPGVHYDPLTATLSSARRGVVTDISQQLTVELARRLETLVRLT